MCAFLLRHFAITDAPVWSPDQREPDIHRLLNEGCWKFNAGSLRMHAVGRRPDGGAQGWKTWLADG